MADTTKQRMVSETAESLRRRGFEGTSFTEILAASGAARGAIYHHFPGGKTELVAQAVEQTGDRVSAALETLPEPANAAVIVEAFLSLVRPVVEESSGGAGCAVAAVATEVAPGHPLQLASGEILDRWCEVIARKLHSGGVSSERSAELAALLVTTLEGAHVLCRAAASVEPFDRAAAALRASISDT